jgi:hypothetical protein
LYRDLDAVRRRRDDGEAGRYAVDRAERHDVVACAGLLAEAGSRRPGGSSSGAECALNEQAIVRRAGLGARVEAIMAAPGDRPFELARA